MLFATNQQTIYVKKSVQYILKTSHIILDPEGFQNPITGSIGTAVLLDQENRVFESRQKKLSWRSNLLCIVVELAGVINWGTPSSF